MTIDVKLLIPGKSGEYVKVFTQFRRSGYTPKPVGKKLLGDGKVQVLAFKLDIEAEDLQLDPGILTRALEGLQYKIIEPSGYDIASNEGSQSSGESSAVEYDFILDEGHETTLGHEDEDMGDIFSNHKGRRDKF